MMILRLALWVAFLTLPRARTFSLILVALAFVGQLILEGMDSPLFIVEGLLLVVFACVTVVKNR